jgi:hypothetical protein
MAMSVDTSGNGSHELHLRRVTFCCTKRRFRSIKWHQLLGLRHEPGGQGGTIDGSEAIGCMASSWDDQVVSK